jgi:hypothetical protein
MKGMSEDDSDTLVRKLGFSSSYFLAVGLHDHRDLDNYILFTER